MRDVNRFYEDYLSFWSGGGHRGETLQVCGGFPMDRRVGRVRNRSNVAAPGHAEDLGRVVNRGLPSSSGECVERGSDGRGHRIVEQDEGMGCGVIGKGDGIVSRRVAFVIAIDEGELPAGSIACERLDTRRTRFADERHAVGDPRKTQRRSDAFVEIGLG